MTRTWYSVRTVVKEAFDHINFDEPDDRGANISIIEFSRWLDPTPASVQALVSARQRRYRMAKAALAICGGAAHQLGKGRAFALPR